MTSETDTQRETRTYDTYVFHTDEFPYRFSVVPAGLLPESIPDFNSIMDRIPQQYDPSLTAATFEEYIKHTITSFIASNPTEGYSTFNIKDILATPTSIYDGIEHTINSDWVDAEAKVWADDVKRYRVIQEETAAEVDRERREREWEELKERIHFHVAQFIVGTGVSLCSYKVMFS